jgi:hypothetical protein
MAIQISTEQLKNTAVTSAKIDLTGTFDYSSGTLRAASPSATSDVATKAYVDNIAAGLHFKDSVKAATTANITLNDTQTIDGVSLSAGDRVLVKDQSTGSQNGVYIVAAGADWTRSTDLDAGAEFPGAALFVRQGTLNGDVGFVCTNDTVTLGSTAITFTEFTGAATIVAGDGLTKTGNTLAVSVDDASIEIASDSLQIKSGGITDSMLAGSISNSKLSNSTISGIALGSNLNALSVVSGSALAMTSYNGSAARSDLAVQVDDSSIEISSNALKVKAAGISNAMLAGSITAEKINKGAGLADNAGNLEIASGVAGAGLAISSQVLSVNVDDSSLEINFDSLRIKAAGVSDSMLAGSISNSKLSNSTISGVALGANLNALTAGNGLSMTSYNGSAAVSDLTIDLDGSSLAVGGSGIKVADGGIASGMLAQSGGSEAVVTAAIRNNAIVTDKINNGAVTSAKVNFSPNYESFTGDGSATTFDVSAAIDANFASGVVAYRNGLAMQKVASSPSGQDQYSVSAAGGSGGVGRITFGTAPNNGDTVSILFWS